MPPIPASEQTVDLTVLTLVHDAFRRDFRALAAALRALPVGAKEQAQGLVHFYDHLVSQVRRHQEVEHSLLLPLVEARVTGPDRAVLATLAARHAETEAAVARVDAPLRHVRDMGATTKALFAALDALIAHLDEQLATEERAVLPVLARHLTAEDVRAFERATRKVLGRKGAAVFFPWILDGVDPDTAARVVRLLPVQQRLAYRRFWQPAYRRELALRSA